MKKIVCLVLVGLMALSLVACKSAEQKALEDALDTYNSAVNSAADAVNDAVDSYANAIG